MSTGGAPKTEPPSVLLYATRSGTSFGLKYLTRCICACNSRLFGSHSRYMNFLRNALVCTILVTAGLFVFLGGDSAYSYSGNPAPENVGMTSQSTVSLTTSGQEVLLANANRQALILQGVSGASTVSISFGGSALSASTLTLTAGTVYQFTPPFTNSIWAKGSVTGVTLLIIEGTK